MKKALLLLAYVLLICGLTACVSPGPASAPDIVQQTAPPLASAPQSTPTPQPAPTPADPVIRLSTTTSVNDSGLLPYLQPTFESKTGYKLEITSNGTGAAIKLGETGDADCLLVHSKAAEEEFVASGFGLERLPFMYNYFVIAGPPDDPLQLAACASAAAAFQVIAESKSAEFVSRGDDSGTHNAEKKIWSAVGVEPAGQSWYISAGAGMGACLNQANERLAYILTDKATFLSMAASVDLVILLERSDEMKNTYSLIAVDPQKHRGINSEGAAAFITWMQSDEAKALIATFGQELYGEPLFYNL
jgi:tungstate transport system substrate-binding protein